MVVPTPGGARNPLVLAAAHLAGVTRAFAIGGAQAIAALAYGTATIPPVDKICGPGNAYVAAAKRRVFGTVGIDMIAGASEVLVIADASAERGLGRDGPLRAGRARRARAGDPRHARRGAARGGRRRARSGRSPAMPRRAIIAASLAHRGALIKVRDLDAACAVANRVAPEHLELAVADPAALLPKIRHAGAIFMGHHASEALGDYCAGTQSRAADGPHRAVLVAARRLRFPEAVERARHLDRHGAQRSAPSPRRSRTAKGLPAHAQSALYRVPANVTVRDARRFVAADASVPRSARCRPMRSRTPTA